MSQLNEDLAFQLRAAKIKHKREVRVIGGRRFAHDFLIGKNLLVEVQGGIYLPKGGHTTGRGVTRDCEKAALALLAGYRTLFVTAEHIRDGRALQWIQKLMGDE